MSMIFFSAKAINIKAIMDNTVSNDPENVRRFMTTMSIKTLEHKDVQKLLTNIGENFDVVIAEYMYNDVLAR